MSKLADALKVTDGEEGTDDKGTDDKGAEEKGTDGNDASEKKGDEDSDDKGTGDDSSNDSDGDSDKGDDDKGDGEADGKADEQSDLDQLKDSQAELRQMLRVMKRENATLKAKVGRIDATDQDDGEDNLDEDGNKIVKLSKIETLQNKVSELGYQREAQLEMLVVQMAETKKYSDVNEVCSKTNVDTIVESAAKIIVEQGGGDITEVMLELEVDIWGRPNPYKYLYDVIKQNHPQYKAAEKKAGDSKSKVDEALKNKAASSIQDMGGSGGDKGGGWSADRIDRLPEDQLNTVPAEVYTKYMAGTLK